MTKIIAFYLPQFHQIPENDIWWGEGFSDWVNVKKAKPIFKGQIQPKIPLNHNYYDLSDCNAIKWQASLAKKYNVYGWCIYHYWFNGKLLLDKPANQILNHPDIQINFCFSWANETWSRTWTGKEREILIKQEYGGEEEWINHYKYLKPFFKDNRYIKEDNKPLFLIYKSAQIPNCENMMKKWNELAKIDGFNGIFFVETLNRGTIENRDLPFDAKVEFEPASIKSSIKKNKIRIRRYIVRFVNKIFKTRFTELNAVKFENELKNVGERLENVGTFAGAFMGWDNTPRRDLAATYISAPTKEQFKEYLRKKIKIGQEIYKTDYLFINAWNEWAEGTYLEPDENNKYIYLEAIKEILAEL